MTFKQAVPLARELSVDSTAVWRSFMTAHARLTHRLEADLLAAHSLSLASYDVLVQLVEATDHRLRMTELSDRVLISRSGLTRLVDRLCLEGLVYREPCASDARGYFTILTAAGYERLRSATGTHLRGVQEYATGRFSPQQLDQFDELLSVLTSDE